ncbi:MAG TPA: beta-phosphoglucomutase [Spirochaeta sp.]|nr:beta-phosphoglucomutase [Spirochaeta sp.]
MESLGNFPIEPWSVSENEFRPENLERNASLFFLGNGYLGIRGGFEEECITHGSSVKGTFINGFYESGPQVYGEAAFGFPDKKQALLNLPDPTGISIFLDDEIFSPDRGRLLEYSRQLKLDEGLLLRKLYWESPSGRKMRLEVTRCVSMVRTHIALISCRISGLEGVDTLRIVSSCGIETVSHETDKSDPRTGAGFMHLPLECIQRRVEYDRAVIQQKTMNSGLSFSEIVSNSHCTGLRALKTASCDEKIDFNYEADIQNSLQTEFHFDKFICFYTSIEEDELLLVKRAVETIDKAELAGADLIINEHKEAVRRFWESADIEIDGDLQQGIRFNIFSIYQSAGRDGFRNIAAKGLSGEGYEGHYFWDTEIYLIPFFTYVFPDIAGSLLKYRYKILEQARGRAGVMSEDGALFPWRTINGEEASAYFPAGTAQYHINADIAYGIRKYESVSGDSEFLNKYGLEILIETARFWLSLGHLENQSGSFRINCVTGPDEYTAIVNNNYFTNIMAKHNLEYAAGAIQRVKHSSPEQYSRITEAVGFRENEPAAWLRAADAMYLPYDEELCVHGQDDSFLQKEPWDFTDEKMNVHPLLLNLHPLVIYRYQILKQPDLVLANFLQGDKFSRIQKMRDYDYYNPITTGDSSLAPCIQSIMAAELGRVEEAYGYFMKTARMDLDDVNSNVSDGVHIAAMGGTWLSLIYGFAGLRDFDGELSFTPRLPEAWSKLRFKLNWQGILLSVHFDHEKAVYSIGSSIGSIKIKHMGTPYTIRAGNPVEISMKPELKAVLFDLDGVITDTSEFHFQAWKRMADEEGYSFSREINERLRGISRLASLDVILEESNVNLPPEQRFELGERKNSYYKELLKSITPENMLPGIAELILALKTRGIKTALASASRNAPEVIERLGIAGDFDLIMDAAAVEKGKPDPEIFVTAAERLGCCPEQCIGVEDAAAGVDAIRSAGIFSVGIGPAACEADWTLSDTSQLIFDKMIAAFGAFGEFSERT